jgi:hypothetical protein
MYGSVFNPGNVFLPGLTDFLYTVDIWQHQQYAPVIGDDPAQHLET